MTLSLPDGDPFATSWQTDVYYEPTSEEDKSRLILQVAIEDIVTEAMVDTGGLYLFCTPTIGRQLDLDETNSLGAQTLLFRGDRVQGTLHRLTLTLFAEEGGDVTIETTAFVPGAHYENTPELPSIMGLQGCLDRLRFAFDPMTDTFYFGPAS